MNINLGSIQMPINSATRAFAILAKRGAGKTYTAAVLAEEFFKAGIPFVVFDPIEAWWGLRVAANGKDKGLPIVVFGSRNADIPLDRDMGRDIARAVVKENISCVISLKGLPKVAQRHIIAEFSEELLNINNTPRHVFIEEAHEFVPQRVWGAMGKTFSAVESLVTLGRNCSIGVTLINQRAATVNKDVLTQLDVLISMRSVGPPDRKALQDWVGAHSQPDDFERFMKSLASLPTGEGWIWSPEFLGVFKRIKIRKRETFHPDPEKIGAKFDVPKIDQGDVQTFIERFLSRKKDVGPKEKRIGEEKAAPVKPIRGLDIEARSVVQLQPSFEELTRTMRNDYESKIMMKDAEINRMHAVIRKAQAILGFPAEGAGVSVENEMNVMLQKLGGMPKKIYEVLLQHSGGLTKRQIGLMCGYASTSGSFANAVGKLKTMGLISRNGDVLQALTR